MALTAGQKIRAADLNQPFGHAGLTAGFVNIQNGAYPALAAQSLTNGMTFATNALTVPRAGLYLIVAKIYLSGSAGPHLLEYLPTLNSAVNPPPAGLGSRPIGNGLGWKGTGEDYTFSIVGHATLAANDLIRLWAKTATSVNAWGDNGYNGSYVEARRVGD